MELWNSPLKSKNQRTDISNGCDFSSSNKAEGILCCCAAELMELKKICFENEGGLIKKKLKKEKE